MDGLGAVFVIVDGCDRALASPGEEDSPIARGMSMVRDQALGELARLGLESLLPIDTPFDHNLHAAVARCPGTPEGRIAQVVRRGWLYRGQLLRPADVIVADGRGCPHGRENADTCLLCFREALRAGNESETRRRRR